MCWVSRTAGVEGSRLASLCVCVQKSIFVFNFGGPGTTTSTAVSSSGPRRYVPCRLQTPHSRVRLRSTICPQFRSTSAHNLGPHMPTISVHICRGLDVGAWCLPNGACWFADAPAEAQLPRDGAQEPCRRCALQQKLQSGGHKPHAHTHPCMPSPQTQV